MRELLKQLSYRHSSNLAVVSNNKYLIEEFPLEKYSKHIPDWYKNIKVDLSNYDKNFKKGEQHTAKSCAGIWDYFKTGYILRFNFDLNIDIKDDHNFDYLPETNSQTFDMSWFNPEMYGNHTPSKSASNTTIKLNTLYKIVSNKSTKVLITDPFYNYNMQYRIVPGIVDPYYVNDVNIIMEPLKKKIQIKRGDPALIMFSLDGLPINTRVASNKDNDIINKNLYKQNSIGLSWYEKLRSSK